MKLIKKKTLAIFTLLILQVAISIQYIQIDNSNDTYEVVEDNNLGEIKVEKTIPKASDYWTEDYILIDDTSSYSNWESLAAEEPWCYGSGTEEDPYIIENVNFTTKMGTAVRIWNSDVYFIIRNSIMSGGTVDSAYKGGISTSKVSHGTFKNNIIYDNAGSGIALTEESNNNTIVGNIIINNGNHGILVSENSNDNTIRNNFIANNDIDGIHISMLGLGPDSNDNNIISRNIIKNNKWNGIGLTQGAYDNIISFNSITNNSQNGIRFEIDVGYNTIFGNSINNNTDDGIFLRASCSNNIIRKNVIANNTKVGIHIDVDVDVLYIAENNSVFQNAFIGNFLHGRDDSGLGDNYWNSSVIGNYWDDYSGLDTTPADGIGDDPYNIVGTTKANDSLPIFNDPIYSGGVIHIDDGGESGNYTWEEAERLTNWVYGSGTLSNPYVIEGLNIDAVGTGSGLIIGNSSVVYFIIRDSNFKNSGAVSGDAGIKLYKTSNGTITGNNITSNGYYGLFLEKTCSNNTISENIITNNAYDGIILYGVPGTHCLNNTISGNFINLNGWDGINLTYSDETFIFGNFINGSSNEGIEFADSDDNIITGNLITNNTKRGIYLEFAGGSTNNLFYKNAFIGNGEHARDQSAFNANNWNYTDIGNYWYNYSGLDSNGDNIGDSPYTYIPAVAKANDSLPIFQLLVNVTVSYPTNNTVFGTNAPNFEIEVEFIVEALEVDTMWYSIYNGTVWSANFTFTANITIDQDSWDALPENVTIIRFYANDALGNVGYRDCNITKYIPPLAGGSPLAAGDDDDDDKEVVIISAGFYFIISLMFAIISLIILKKRKIMKQN